MKRPYENTATENVQFFIGEEVERSIMYGQRTLFVVGTHAVQTLEKVLSHCAVQHVYLGANQSFEPDDQFVAMAQHLLDSGYWVTLDYPVQHQAWVNSYANLNQHQRFVSMISVALPAVAELNGNAVLKIDDTGFNATNAGVWCHRLSNLLSDGQFTGWDDYTQDSKIDVDKL